MLKNWEGKGMTNYERIRNLKKLEDFTRACIGENDCPNCRLFDFAELECTRERLQRPPYCSRCGAKMDGEDDFCDYGERGEDK